MKLTERFLLYAMLVLSFAVLIGLGGCADAPTQQVPVVVNVAPAPIVSECNPQGRAKFPPVQKVTGDKTPTSNLGDAYISGKSADTTNRIRETRCYCAQVAERGSDAEKAASQKECGAVETKAPKQTILKKLTKYVGS